MFFRGTRSAASLKSFITNLLIKPDRFACTVRKNWTRPFQRKSLSRQCLIISVLGLNIPNPILPLQIPQGSSRPAAFPAADATICSDPRDGIWHYPPESENPLSSSPNVGRTCQSKPAPWRERVGVGESGGERRSYLFGRRPELTFCPVRGENFSFSSASTSQTRPRRKISGSGVEKKKTFGGDSQGSETESHPKVSVSDLERGWASTPTRVKKKKTKQTGNVVAI